MPDLPSAVEDELAAMGFKSTNRGRRGSSYAWGKYFSAKFNESPVKDVAIEEDAAGSAEDDDNNEDDEWIYYDEDGEGGEGGEEGLHGEQGEWEYE